VPRCLSLLRLRFKPDFRCTPARVSGRTTGNALPLHFGKPVRAGSAIYTRTLLTHSRDMTRKSGIIGHDVRYSDRSLLRHCSLLAVEQLATTRLVASFSLAVTVDRGLALSVNRRARSELRRSAGPFRRRLRCPCEQPYRCSNSIVQGGTKHVNGSKHPILPHRQARISCMSRSICSVLCVAKMATRSAPPGGVLE
jgi:hypothetical protein